MDWKKYVVLASILILSTIVSVIAVTNLSQSDLEPNETLEFEYIGIRLVRIYSSETNNETHSPWILFANRGKELKTVRIELFRADIMLGENIFYIEPNDNEGISFQSVAKTSSDFRITIDELDDFTIKINGKEIELTPIEIFD